LLAVLAAAATLHLASFQNGLAFCALLHRYKPELIDFAQLTDADPKRNLELAFDVAHTQYGVSKYSLSLSRSLQPPALTWRLLGSLARSSHAGCWTRTT
jgi:hypothetical protein